MGFELENIRLWLERLNPLGHSPKLLKLLLFIETLLKIMKNAFYFIFKALFVFKIFNFFSWLFGYVQKSAWLKNKVNIKIYDITTWLTNNYNALIAQYLTK